jgi:hypothetical protein
VRNQILPRTFAALPPEAQGFAKRTMLDTWGDLMRRVERTEALPS